jgi:fructokinase
MSVLVVGEALIDLIVAPDATVDARPGGGPYNAARTLARLGTSVQFLGGLSEDRFGTVLRSRLAADGVGLDHVVTTSAPTTLAVAELDPSGAATYRFYLEGTSAPQVDPDQARGGLGPGTRAVHVGTLGLVLEPLATSTEALVAGLAPGHLLFVDPNCRPRVIGDAEAYLARVRRILGRADVVKVSGDDLDALAPGVEPREAARGLLAHGPRVVLFTDGAATVRVLTPGAEDEVEVPAVEVVDTVGAGDAFGAAFLGFWLTAGRGRDDLTDRDALVATTRRAVEVASITCQRVGADPPRLDELPS